jgi:phage terminase small subunit
MIAPMRDGKIDHKLRRKLYRQYRLSGMCIFDSAMKAGYSRNTAYAQGKRLDRVGNIRQTLEVMGVSDESVINTLKDCLVAERPIVCDKEISMVPDHTIRHKTAETVLKLKGHLDKDIAMTGVTNIQVNFNLTEAKDAHGEAIEVEAIDREDRAIELPSVTETIIGFEELTRPEDS